MTTVLSPEEFRAHMIDRHRNAFSLWCRCHKMAEDVVTTLRDVATPFAIAIDILFIQAFKSHGSLYFLCVHGHGEDGATIVRRMLEIAFQVEYLCVDEQRKTEKAEKFLAYFWLQAPQKLKIALPRRVRDRWEINYAAANKLLVKINGKPYKNWWGDSSIKDLAGSLGHGQTYDEDYRFLSQFAHCTSQGLLSRVSGGTVEIRTDRLIPQLLIFGTRYFLKVFEHWNRNFNFLKMEILERLADDAIHFFQPHKS